MSNQISVYNLNGVYLSSCTPERAKKMVNQKKAKWKTSSSLTLLVTKDDKKSFWSEAKVRDDYTCYICGTKVTDQTASKDHVIPRSRGGTEFLDNLACACAECNELKGDLTYMELCYNFIMNIEFMKLGYQRREIDRAFYRYIGNNIRLAREALDMPQEELVDITKSVRTGMVLNIKWIEQGKQILNKAKLTIIANAVKVSVKDLLEGRKTE